MLVNVQTLKVNQTEGRRFETRNKAKNRSVFSGFILEKLNSNREIRNVG